jgi:hypothetical protein
MVTIGRNPYQAHLCVQDPTAWEAGFRTADGWLRYLAHTEGLTPDRITQAIHHSSGVPFPHTAASVGLVHGPWVEGFMLGVYGLVTLERTTP